MSGAPPPLLTASLRAWRGAVVQRYEARAMGACRRALPLVSERPRKSQRQPRARPESRPSTPSACALACQHASARHWQGPNHGQKYEARHGAQPRLAVTQGYSARLAALASLSNENSHAKSNSNGARHWPARCARMQPQRPARPAVTSCGVAVATLLAPSPQAGPSSHPPRARGSPVCLCAGAQGNGWRNQRLYGFAWCRWQNCCVWITTWSKAAMDLPCIGAPVAGKSRLWDFFAL